MLFLCFTARASRALAISTFKLDIFQDREPPHKKNRNVVRFVTRLCSSEYKSSTDYSIHFKGTLFTLKNIFLDIE